MGKVVSVVIDACELRKGMVIREGKGRFGVRSVERVGRGMGKIVVSLDNRAVWVYDAHAEVEIR